MFVRASTWKGSPEQLEAWRKLSRKESSRSSSSFRATGERTFLIDREGEKALTLTIWESEDAALASDQAADASRSRTMDSTGLTMVSKDRCEIVASI